MKRIVLERQKLDMSQAELGRRIGTSTSNMNRIEKDKNPPYPLRAIRIARALGWEGDPTELFEEVNENEQDDASA